MAAPASANIHNMTGNWILNRELSDDFDSTFALQGVPWALRKILSFAGVSLHMTQTTSVPEDNLGGGPVVSIRVKQVVTPGGFSSEESYVLDSQSRDSTVPIFGALSAHSKYVPVAEISDETFKQRAADGDSDTVIQEFAESKTGEWVTEGIWTFENVNGVRHFTRTNVTSRGEERVVARLVYDWRQE